MFFLRYISLILVLLVSGGQNLCAMSWFTSGNAALEQKVTTLQNELKQLQSRENQLNQMASRLDGIKNTNVREINEHKRQILEDIEDTRKAVAKEVKDTSDLVTKAVNQTTRDIGTEKNDAMSAINTKKNELATALDNKAADLKQESNRELADKMNNLQRDVNTFINNSIATITQKKNEEIAKFNTEATQTQATNKQALEQEGQRIKQDLIDTFKQTQVAFLNDKEKFSREMLALKAEQKKNQLEYERQTAQIIADAEEQTAKITAEIASKAEQEKEKLRLKHEVEHADLISKKKVEQIQEQTKATFEQAAKMIQDGKTLAAIATATGLTIASILVVKNLLPVVKKAIEEHLFTPALVSDTSYQGITGLFKKKQTPQQTLANLYFNPKLKKQVETIVATLRGTKKNNGFYQNYLLYGPPGTGKTALARALAYESGMDYAIFSGGDVQKLLSSGKAAEKIADIFKWANKSNKGLILFIDEADAFLKDPNKYKMSDELYSVLNSFLNLTGTESKKICLIMSTNHPQNLPPAVLSRVGPGQYIYMGLPEYPERLRIAKHFLNLYLGRYFVEKIKAGDPELAGDNSEVKVGDTKLDDAGNPVYNETLKGEIADYIAKKTDKFSGRNLSYLILAIEKAMLAEKMTTLDNALIDRVVTEAVEQRNASESFKSEA